MSLFITVITFNIAFITLLNSIDFYCIKVTIFLSKLLTFFSTELPFFLLSFILTIIDFNCFNNIIIKPD